MADTIDKILQQKKQGDGQALPENEPDKFYSILGGEGLQENFFEVRFRDGNIICFSYEELSWFDYDPEKGRITLEFGGISVILEGRGLVPKLFHGIKSKRIAWVREADMEMQDHKDNETFIKEIIVIAPEGFTGEAESEK